MTRHFLILLSLLLTAHLPLLHAAPGTLVNDSIIDPLAHNFPTPSFSVDTVHGVSFQQDGVVTYKGWQYAAYYQGNTANGSGRVAVARRPLPGGTWQTVVLNDYLFTNVDSHNDVVIGICAGDGTIHLSFDHHVHPLKYRVSVSGLADNPTTTAWTAAQFGPVTDRLLAGGSAVSQVTYPRFIPNPSGKLLFTYRSGSSGGGDEVLYEYDGVSHAWSPVGQYTTRTGSYTGTFASGSDRNAYFDNTVFDANGRLHATWCWRETPDASSNHDLMYAYSDDSGRTWKNGAGSTVGVAGTSFISVNSPGIIGWSIPQKRNYINNSAMTVDRQGRIHVVGWLLPSSAPDQTTFSTSLSSASRFIHFWRGTDGIWRKNETTLTGTRAKLASDDDGRLFLIYGDATNVRIAAANPAADPEANPAASWSDWALLSLSGALPAGRADNVNIITDSSRWDADRIISVYAQETNITGTAPTPLHILDYHVSRAAVLPVPLSGSTLSGISTSLAWTSGQEASQHDVYLGTSAAAVAAASTASPLYLGRQSGTSLPSGGLSPGTTYYWRIDSVSATSAVTTGRVWSFTTATAAPSVANGASMRGGGTAVTFRGSLALPLPATTDVTLYWGNADGGVVPANWQNSVSLGTEPAGPFEITLPTTSADAVFYRFRASNENGVSWASPAGILPSVMPVVSQGVARRSYGGRCTFPVTLDPVDPALSTAELTLFYGNTDGGSDALAWEHSLPLGPKAAGSQLIELDGLPPETLWFRFRLTTIHGSSWAADSGGLDTLGDLATWARSAVIEVTGYAGSSTLTDFPLLVRLSPSLVPGFAYSEMLSPPHGDLRFSLMDGTPLSHEVENWNTSGVSQVWVKLPQLAQGTKLRVWWGKAGQSAPASSAAWSAFNGVWHLDSDIGFSKDSSPNGLAGAATSVTSATTAVIPGAATLNGTSSNVSIDNAAALSPAAVSMEAWVKTSVGTGTLSIFSRDQTSGATNRVWQFRLNTGRPDLIIFNAGSNAAATSPDTVADNQFHHIFGTWDGTTIRMYVDGVLKASTAFSGTLRSGQTNKAFIGRSENTTPNYFNGSIDEVRLSSAARSADWVRATFDSGKPTAAFITGSAAAVPDLDSDLLADSWEISSFGDLAQTSTGDVDADGTSNRAEFLLGLDPKSGSSVFKASSSGATVQWQGKAGLNFVVQRSTSLGTWSVVSTQSGVEGGNIFTDPSPPVGNAFYRILLVMP